MNWGKTLLLTFLLLSGFGLLNAQVKPKSSKRNETKITEMMVKDTLKKNYLTAIGLRAGYQPGITLKHFVDKETAFEYLFHTRYIDKGYIVTVLYEKHSKAFSIKNLNWVYGLGGHVGLFRSEALRDRKGFYYNDPDQHNSDKYRLSAGVDGIFGVEYRITEIPFTVSCDIKPFFDMVNPGYGYIDGAISLRYILK